MKNVSANKNWLYSKYIAHRGLHGGSVKQNTLKAFCNAIEKGYNIELDVQLTKDFIPVVFHDFNLKQLTGNDVNIYDITYKDLKTITYSNSNCGIPSLKETLELCQGRTGLMVEIKKKSLEEEDYIIEQNILPLLKKYKGNFIVKSFNPYCVDFFRKENTNFTRGFLSDALTIEDYPEKSRNLVLELISNTEKKVDFIDFGVNRLDSSEFLKIVTKMPLIVWTVRSKEIFNKIKNKVDNLIFENFLP